MVSTDRLAIQELPDFQVLDTVMSRRDFLLVRAQGADGGTRLVQIFHALRPDSNAFARMQRACSRVRKAAGSGILKIQEIRSGDGKVCLVREDFGGLPLDVFLEGQALDIQERLALAMGLTTILERIHRSDMVHLALSPDNVLVDPADHRIKIWNCFGEPGGDGLDAPGVAEAERVLPFRSPEQFGRLNRTVDHRADLYACGVLFYLLFARRLPFQARSPEEWAYCHLARTPLPADSWDGSTPPVLSQLIARLLAKDPDDRYQTAHGLLLDLEDCRDQLEETGKIQVLSQAGNSRRGEFFLPQRLYGREPELGQLQAVWDALRPGLPGVVMASGAPGKGKSGLIREWTSALPSETLLARGKFDPANTAPLSAWRAALVDLLRQCLERPAEAARLRARARECLDHSEGLVRELLPELAAFLDPVPGPEAAMAPGPASGPTPGLAAGPVAGPAAGPEGLPRMLAGLERLLAGLSEARPGLAILLDDMQWADAGSLKLFARLAGSSAFTRLLLIGTCREPESGKGAAADAVWEQIGRPGGERFLRIRLPPLSQQAIQRFIADALGEEPGRVASLAALVHVKSRGNPFHMREILSYLHRERILRYSPASGWSWELGRLAKVEDGFTLGNLVAERWMRLTAWEREILSLAACAGPGPLLEDLLLATGRRREELLEALQGPSRLGFLAGDSGDFRFAHDRLWESLYSQLPESQRRPLHGRLARALLDAGGRDVHKIVRHLQAAGDEPRNGPERLRIARTFLEAGAKSRASASPGAAYALYAAGRDAAGEACWAEDAALALELRLGGMECAYLGGDLAGGDRDFEAILRHCGDPLELARVYGARMTALGEANALDRAVDSLRRGLALLGGALPSTPAGIGEAIREELARAERLRQGRSLQDFAEAPEMTDPGFLAATDLLARSAMILFYSDQNLLTLVQLRMVNLILEHGNTLQSPFAYLAYGWFLAAEGEDYASAHAFGRLAVESVARRGGARQGCMLEEIHGSMIQHWVRPFRECAGLLGHAFRLGQETGDLHYGMLAWLNRMGMLLIAGEPLERLDAEFRGAADLFARMGETYPGFLFRLRWSQIRRLRGGPPPDPAPSGRPGDGGGAALDAGNQLARFNHHHAEAVIAFLAGDLAAARRHSAAAERWRGRANALPATAEHAFYAALILAGLQEEADAELARYRARLAEWAGSCPANYRARHLLVEAEVRRREGRQEAAEELYRAAARDAEEQGQIQIAALAYEAAARACLARGSPLAAEALLARALRGYREWGAGAKASALLAAHPCLAREAMPGAVAEEPARALARGDGRGRDDVLRQVLEACRSFSAEVSPEPLLAKLMETLMAISGAQKGCFLLEEGEALVLAAESAEGGGTRPGRRTEAEAPEALAWSAARFAFRNRRPLALEDAHREGLFREDPHVRARRIRSLLCLPVFAEGGNRGLLYLENNGLAGAFTQERTGLLELIASQAAISLRNCALYGQARDLAAHLQSVREGERQKVARDVHDELGHALTALHLDLGWLARKGPGENPEYRERVAGMARLVETTVQSVQRIISELRPAVLDQLGLCEALEWQVRELGKRSGLDCRLDLPERNPEMPPEAAAALFRILQEGISNILRHAEARRAWVRLATAERGAELRLEIRDDGRGVTEAQINHPLSFGLAGMRERLRPWGGRLTIAQAGGMGTVVTAALPLPVRRAHA